jgi:hypothetical protein
MYPIVAIVLRRMAQKKVNVSLSEEHFISETGDNNLKVSGVGFMNFTSNQIFKINLKSYLSHRDSLISYLRV